MFDPDLYQDCAQFTAAIEELGEQSSQGNGQATFELAMVLYPENTRIPSEFNNGKRPTFDETRYLYETAFHQLLPEAEQGNCVAMNLVAIYHQCGFPPVSVNMDKFFEWNTRAYDAGCVGAAHDLIVIHSNRNSIHYNPERATEMARRLQEAIDAEEASN